MRKFGTRFHRVSFGRDGGGSISHLAIPLHFKRAGLETLHLREQQTAKSPFKYKRQNQNRNRPRQNGVNERYHRLHPLHD